MEQIQWNVPEYFYTEKGSDWYWIVAIIAISMAIIAILLNNIIFAVLILVSVFTLTLFASRKPEIVNVSIGTTGITVGRTFHPYMHLESYWVEVNEHHPRIIIKSKKTLLHFIVILINEEEVRSEDVRHVLSNYLPEEKHVEPFLEKLLVYFGF